MRRDQHDGRARKPDHGRRHRRAAGADRRRAGGRHRRRLHALSALSAPSLRRSREPRHAGTNTPLPSHPQGPITP
ncbi:Adenosylhomocysteinase [Burkholderia gladioli]|nr:Adenosylhomocysteinase [Burkholderia gladioli]